MIRKGCVLCGSIGIQLLDYTFNTLLGMGYETYFCVPCNQTVMSAIRKAMSDGNNGYVVNLHTELEFKIKQMSSK